MVLFTTREKLKKLDDLLEKQGMNWQEFLSIEPAEIPPPEKDEVLRRCPRCQGSDVDVCIRTWFVANIAARAAPPEALITPDRGGLRAYHCNDCEEDCIPTKEIVK